MFDKSALEAVVSQTSKKLAIKAVAGAATAKLLIDSANVTFGVKGQLRVNKLSNSVHFQSGAVCGARSAIGDVVLSDKLISIAPIKDVQNICVPALYNTYYASMISQGADPANENIDATFINQIMEDRAANIAAAVEVLLWQGDTAGAGNLVFIDGLIKTIAAASDENNVTLVAGTYISQLQALYKACPVAVRKSDDFRIFLSETAYDQYLIELDTANKFRTESQDTLTGTSAKFAVTPGLNGTTKVYGMRISDMQLGMDGLADESKVSLKYSMETEQFYSDFFFAVGVAPIWTSEISVGDLVG